MDRKNFVREKSKSFPVDRERFYLITEDGIYGEFEPLKEAQSLSRVWKHGQTGLAVLSAFRSEYSESENLKRHSKLKSILRSNDLGYWEVDGLYQDEDYRGADFTFNPDNPYDEELSCFVPYNPAAFDTFEDFAEFIEDVGIGEFDQDSVLLVSPDEEAYLVMKSGGIEKLGTRVSPDKVLAAHTKLRKGSHKGRGFIVEYAIRKAQSTNDAYAMRAQGIL